MNNFQEFINTEYVYLVVGVSQDKTKWGYRILKTLYSYGYTVYGVNPKYQEVDGRACFESISKFKAQMSKLNVEDIVVVTVVPPAVTEKIVEESLQLGITKIWMQEGSGIENVKVQSSKLKIIKDKCIIRDGLGKPFMV